MAQLFSYVPIPAIFCFAVSIPAWIFMNLQRLKQAAALPLPCLLAPQAASQPLKPSLIVQEEFYLLSVFRFGSTRLSLFWTLHASNMI